MKTIQCGKKVFAVSVTARSSHECCACSMWQFMWYVVINIQLKCLCFLTLSNMPACPLDMLFKPHGNKCLQCGQYHLTKNEAREHAVTHDQTLQPQLEEWRAATSTKRKRCNRCGQDFTADMIPLAMCGACGKDFKM